MGVVGGTFRALGKTVKWALILGALLIVILIIVFVAALGSSDTLKDQPGTIRVQAPKGKCWSGAIGDSTKDGCGSRTFKITGETIIVGNAQKQTPGHWRLRMTLVVDGKVKDRSATTAEFGVAQVAEAR